MAKNIIEQIPLQPPPYYVDNYNGKRTELYNRDSTQ